MVSKISLFSLVLAVILITVSAAPQRKRTDNELNGLENDLLAYLLKRYEPEDTHGQIKRIATRRDGTCPPGYLLCSERYCMGIAAQCNGHDDCGNCADEIGCSSDNLIQSGCQDAQPVETGSSRIGNNGQSGSSGQTGSSGQSGNNGQSGDNGQAGNTGDNGQGQGGSDLKLCDPAPGFCCDETGNADSHTDLDDLRKQLLNSHNYYRCLHGSPEMTLKADLNDFAQTHAEVLASQGASYHSDRGESPPDRGENILTIGSARLFPKAEQFYGKYPVEQWYSENVYYDFDYPQTNLNNGHFSQLIWKESVDLGCGVAIEPKQYYDKMYVVCQYRAPGMLSNLEDNVQRKVY